MCPLLLRFASGWPVAGATTSFLPETAASTRALTINFMPSFGDGRLSTSPKDCTQISLSMVENLALTRAILPRGVKVLPSFSTILWGVRLIKLINQTFLLG